MYGYLFPDDGRRLRLFPGEVLGQPLLGIGLPRRISRRTRHRIIRELERRRVGELLSRPEELDSFGLPPLVSTRSVWLSQAVPLTLTLLEQRGLSPRHATVELWGDRFNRENRRLIEALIPRVRRLNLSMPVPEEFLWQMQREYGFTPSLECGDLALCLAPDGPKDGVPLWMDRPAVPEVELWADLPELPEGCPRLPLLAALTDQGRLSPEQIKIRGILA